MQTADLVSHSPVVKRPAAVNALVFFQGLRAVWNSAAVPVAGKLCCMCFSSQVLNDGMPTFSMKARSLLESRESKSRCMATKSNQCKACSGTQWPRRDNQR